MRACVGVWVCVCVCMCVGVRNILRVVCTVVHKPVLSVRMFIYLSHTYIRTHLCS